jgi:hypothetical protein
VAHPFQRKADQSADVKFKQLSDAKVRGVSAAELIGGQRPSSCSS